VAELPRHMTESKKSVTFFSLPAPSGYLRKNWLLAFVVSQVSYPSSSIEIVPGSSYIREASVPAIAA